jgi:hypothetical protein
MINKWFSRSMRNPVSTDQNSRFAERLDAVWFKYNKPSRLRPGAVVAASARLGSFLTDLLNKVNDLITRVEKLEGTSAIQPSSMNRTAMGFNSTPTKAELIAAQAVRDFVANNSISSTVWVDGVKITIERR